MMHCAVQACAPPHLAELVVAPQVVAVAAAGLGAQQCHVAMVPGGGHVAVGNLQLLVEGGGGKVQALPAHVAMPGGDEVHRGRDPGLQVSQREEELQQLEGEGHNGRGRGIMGEGGVE